MRNSEGNGCWQRRLATIVITVALVATAFMAWRVVELLRSSSPLFSSSPAASSGEFDRDLSQYRRGRSHKALAVSYDQPDGHWAWGWGTGYLTLREAISEAREHCESQREENHLATACRLYAVNDDLVLDYSDAALKELLAKYRSMEELDWHPDE